MKREMFLATAFAAALAVGAAAQTPPQNPPATGSQDRPQQVTVTGCLAQAPSASTSATGTTGTAGSTDYILKNATMGSGSAASNPAGTSGAATSASAMGKSFKLVGGSSSDLKDNLNAKVEVKGSIEKPSATAPPAGATAGERDVQTLRVTSVKKIADSCQ